MNKYSNEIICSRCGKTNTEFSTFKTPIKINLRKHKIFRKRRYKLLLLLLPKCIEYEVDICQTCLSKMFRGLDKNK